MTEAPDATALAEVDRLVRQGDLAAGAAALDAALAGRDASAAQWLQLAGLRRALRQPGQALDAVHRALTLAPFDFVGLVMRASLLERLNDAEAGQAWDNALARKPETELAPPLAAAVAAGEVSHARWIAAREARLRQAAATALAGAEPEEDWRIGRFRSNVLRQTKVYHSEPTHFFVPGLTEREFHPRQTFPWLSELEAATPAIRAEMKALMASQRAELVPYIQYPAHEALAQWRPLNHNPDWTAIHLWNRGQLVEENAAQCPQTMALLAGLPQPQIAGASPNAMFSLLAPHTRIPAHVGVNNARLVCHLPLVVPQGCWFRVGAETRAWREGEAFVFDDTIEHEAMNPSDHLRVVLIFDIWHPDLSEREAAAVAAMIATENVPCPL